MCKMCLLARGLLRATLPGPCWGGVVLIRGSSAWTTQNRKGTVTFMSSLIAGSHVAWRKSSHSIANGDCVEAASRQGEIAVRDSEDPEGLILRYPADAWRSFVAKLKQD